MNLFDLSGRVAIVTGSTRGIGRAIAERLAEHGARVVISSRTESSCNEVAAAITARHGERSAVAIPASIASKDQLQWLVDRTRVELGPIGILVCNAASNPYYGPMSGISDEQFRKILENNVLANHWLIQKTVPDMVQARDGAIVVVSSIAGLRGSDSLGAYGISKAADMQLVRSLAVELGPHNVRVNGLAPGVIRTDFARALWGDPTIEVRMTQHCPLRRFGDPDDVAGLAVCLAGPAGRFVTGQTLVVDGGDTVA
jgi:NAD(P)-dependent dehydrogenase (short-subunit alcohol dehydrogenase family)